MKEENVKQIDHVTKSGIHYCYITLVSRGAFCKNCHTFTKKVHGYKEKPITHSILIKKQMKIIYRQRRYICTNKECGKTVIENDPFTSSHKKITKATRDNVLELLKDYNQTYSSVAREMNISPTLVQEIFDEHLQIRRKELQEVICVDEFYLGGYHKNKYACMLIGFKNGLILDVLPSRHKSHLRSYFRTIPIEERNKVRYVSMDMYDTYREIAHIYLKNAVCCTDSFHLAKNVNEVLNDIRCKVMNRYRKDKKSDEYYLLKYKNKLLFLDGSKIEDEKYRFNHHYRCDYTDGALLEKILSIDSQLKEAYDLKELFMIFNRSTEDRESLSSMLEALINEFKLSSIDGYRTFGYTLESWKEETLNSFITYDGRRISNGPIEGRNKYIKVMLELSNGISNFKRFRNRILYVFNKHEVPSDTVLDTRLLKLPGTIRGKYNKE